MISWSYDTHNDVLYPAFERLVQIGERVRPFLLHTSIQL